MKTLEWALNYRIPFGDFRGHTIEHAYARSPAFIEWLIEHVDHIRYPELSDALAIFGVWGIYKTGGDSNE